MSRFKYIIYFLILILTYKVNSNILQQNENLEEYSSYITNFIFNNCNQCKNILIAHTPDGSKIINTFFNHLYKNKYFTNYYSIQLNQNLTIEDEFTNDYSPDLLILIVDNFDQIGDVVYGLELLSFWSVRSKFLFIVEEITEIYTDTIEDVFTSFLERQILRVLIYYRAADNFHLLTYNPFTEEFGLDALKLNSSLEIFNGKITNMHKYPLKLYHFDYVFSQRLIRTKNNDGKEVLYGFDGIFYDLVAHALNASLDIHAMSEDFSADLVNSADSGGDFMTYMKVISDVFDFDGLFSAIYTINTGDKQDHVILFDRNDLLILVPKAKVIPRYLYLILIIQPAVLYCILTSFIVLSLVMAFTEKLHLCKYNLFKICLDNYRILLNESPPPRPNRSRILFLVWSLQSLVIATLFQSSLISTLIKPKYYENIDTIADLLKTDMKIYAAKVTVNLFKKLEDQNEEFLNRFKETPSESVKFGMDLDWIFDYIDEDAVVICAEALWNTDPNQENKYHVMEERAVAAYLWYSFRKDKNFYREICRVSSWINQAGLNIYWRRYNYGEKFLDGFSNKTNSFENNNANSKLKLEHLQGAFLFLFGGYIIALVVFILEITIAPCCVKNRR